MNSANRDFSKGTSAILFAPLAGCTRVQAVTFLYRYEQL